MSTPCVGVNIGAVTIKAAVLRAGTRSGVVLAHQGRPREALQTLLARAEFADPAYFGVSGHLGHIPEVAAIQRALDEIAEGFDAVAALGGESFLVYLLAGGKIRNVLSHNKCAAGSGEFFVQQIGRMGLGLAEAIERSFEGKVVPLASRCSVHCKSDITHKLNRQEANPADILHTLHDSMAAKVIALLEKSQCELRRVLVIGGVSLNQALLAALREKRPGTEFVVCPESPWFEAWGGALLVRDQPRYRSPQLAPAPSLRSLPALGEFAGRVRVIPDAPRAPPGKAPLVLGVDAGSTTTKAVLLDAETRGVVASHYTRTCGDPLAATRECLRALAGQVGSHSISLVATTGSARELAGAYLGTEHVYNEISAHAAGAALYDAEVDTIFEIGGQDAKYIYLRNGVPVDYAMNNACSAGTGSFLEESARSDLGLGVEDIASVALAAPAPIQFKATCAAFINSDIRLVQQQGGRRDNIVAGLVYAIAENYLTKVKGQRPVGRKVFVQGGVALNQAVGCAFAQRVGSPVLIPPHPELLGALGVAVLALQRGGTTARRPTALLTLAAPEMTRVSQFHCRACNLHCSIDRFEVAGRRFPFGGRCSLYENVWKQKARRAAAPDLIEQRAELLFGGADETIPDGRRETPTPTCAPGAPVERSVKARWEHALGRGTGPGNTVTQIGVPRALTTHALFPLYSTFLSSVGMDVVLSAVDPEGTLKANSAFCLPAQMAHGAVLDLTRRGVRTVFLPHVVRMPHASECRDSYLCPITQAGPYFLAKAFPDMRLLSPELDFANGYDGCAALVELAVSELGVPRKRAEDAGRAAAQAQTDTERALREMGERALRQAIATGEPVILLTGHSYNAFTPEGSQSVARKLASMGITVIPADCVSAPGPGAMAWHYANQIMNAVALVKQHPNLYLLSLSNFSCTIDAFTHAQLASELGAKPYLTLEIDAHTADAGVQTRLEAFLDIIHNCQAAQPRPAPAFTPCRLIAGGQVLRSNGERVPLTDPRVRIYFPNFSNYHAQALALAARWLGLHPGAVIPLEHRQLDRGLQFTSGRECLPLPICLGQLLQIHEARAEGEIAGFYMLSGGAPCVSDAYLGYFKRFLAEQQLPDLFLLHAGPENDHFGFDPSALSQHLSAAIFIADILVELEHVLRVVAPEESVRVLQEQWQRLAAQSSTLETFEAALRGFIDRLQTLPRTREPKTCPRVVLTGDFFTRFSPFFMEGVRDCYARHGIILKPVDLSDLLSYCRYHGVAETASDWGLPPGGLALAKACTRFRQPDGREYLSRWLTYQVEHHAESRYRRLFQRTGLLVADSNDAASLFAKATEHISPTIFGEAVPTVGKGLCAAAEGYDGIIVMGPFNCLPFRISEAILKPLSVQNGMPLLTYESDGYAVSPSVLRQVDVHIQQVLDHAAQRRPSAWL